ncbi:uncharacterized protein J7T54_004330 [Emericellopsis cladophorae]|uniref:Uncharacterized protein n=1 Tax=Emericellopsis cladophorae TaxID=2686198 RepID=A0A9P9Y4Y2_9HYPO|nr:uncharacterized protein J7T54_004330 [Emericellopsis cladophorae]KAI6783303.1 hypothetical protein J7T54_004330 [Emericellopsis cladophorae]
MDSPPAKRLKLTAYDPYDERDPSDEDEGDELELEPEEVSEMRHPDYVLERKRARAMTRYEQAMAGIIAKYSRDFEDVGDELDLSTGAIVVDRGHLRNMRYDTDLGMENDSGEDECEDKDEGVLLCDISDDWGDQPAVATQQADSVFLGGLETASSVSEKRRPKHTMQKPKPRKGRPAKSAKDFGATSIWAPEAGDEDDWVPYPRRRKSTMGQSRRAMAMPNVDEDGRVSATDRDAGSGTGLDENPDNLKTNGIGSHAEYALASKPHQPIMQTRAADTTQNLRKDASSKPRRVMDNRAQSPSKPKPVPDINGNMVEGGHQNSAEDDVHANSKSLRRSGRGRRQVEFLGKVAWPKRKERESKDVIDIALRSGNTGDSECNRREPNAIELKATRGAGNNEDPEEYRDCNASAIHGDLVGSSCFVIAIPTRVRCDEYQHVEDIPDDSTPPTPPESSQEASYVDMGHKDVSVERMTIPDSESEPLSVLDANTRQSPCDASGSDTSHLTQPTNPAVPPSRPDSPSGYTPIAAETSVSQGAESASSMAMVPPDDNVADQDLADHQRPDEATENEDTSSRSANNAPAGEPSNATLETDAEHLHDIETMLNGTPELRELTIEDVTFAAADVTEAEDTETTSGAQDTILENDKAPTVDAEVIKDADVGPAAEAQPDSFPPQLQTNGDGLQQTIFDSDDPPPFLTDELEDPDTARSQLPPLVVSPNPEKTLEPGMEPNHLMPSRDSDVASSSPSRRLKRLSLAKPSTPRHPDAEEDELLRSDVSSPLVGHSAHGAGP